MTPGTSRSSQGRADIVDRLEKGVGIWDIASPMQFKSSMSSFLLRNYCF